MKAHATPKASIDQTEDGFVFRIPAGNAFAYRLAQLDDYFGLARKDFANHFRTLTLRARVSSLSLPGTWGFGFWNDPFISVPISGNRMRLPALPNAAWFFGASRENHLSFGAKPAQGFLVQSFRAPSFHPKLIAAGLAFPFSRKRAREILGQIIDEDSSALSVDVTQWHGYRLEWSQSRVAWYVDELLVYESPVSPNPPLGLVIWIDNQFARFTPEGKIGFGVLANPEPAWLEIENLELS